MQLNPTHPSIHLGAAFSASSTQGHIERHDNHSHPLTHTYREFRILNLPHVHVYGEPGENPHIYRENTQTPQKKGPRPQAQDWSNDLLAVRQHTGPLNSGCELKYIFLTALSWKTSDQTQHKYICCKYILTNACLCLLFFFRRSGENGIIPSLKIHSFTFSKTQSRYY